MAGCRNRDPPAAPIRLNRIDKSNHPSPSLPLAARVSDLPAARGAVSDGVPAEHLIWSALVWWTAGYLRAPAASAWLVGRLEHEHAEDEEQLREERRRAEQREDPPEDGTVPDLGDEVGEGDAAARVRDEGWFPGERRDSEVTKMISNPEAVLIAKCRPPTEEALRRKEQ